jgi:Cytochrome P460
MKKKALASISMIMISLTIVASGLLRPSATPKPSGAGDDNILIQLESYRKWTLVNPDPVLMDRQAAIACGRYIGPDANPNPHSTRYINVYVNQPGREAMITRRDPLFPQGSIIVKEKLPDPLAKAPELLAVMFKREQGYNPESGDWEYLVLDGSASTIKARGKLEKCNACHISSKSSDYVDRSYLPNEIRQRLQ